MDYIGVHNADGSAILQTVANPPMMMFVPAVPAAANIGLQMAIQAILYVFFGVPFFMYLLTVVTGHIVLAMYAARDQHIQTVAQAWGRYASSKNNIIPSEHKKYVP